MKDIIIAIDAGGTTITAVAMTTELKFLTAIDTYPSFAKGSADEIIDNLYNIIYSTFSKIQGNPSTCIGLTIGFPGPFDYTNGISYMKDIDKYDSLYCLSLKEMLLTQLNKNPLPSQIDDIQIFFANDATLFTLGEYIQLCSKDSCRLMGITIGTGCGSTFIDNGYIIAGECGIPEDGMIYHKSYKDSVIDDYVSKRGILGIAAELGYDSDQVEVVDIYNDAIIGHSNAKNTFISFGEILVDALIETIESYTPDIIVIGGQIAKAYDFFGQQLNVYAKLNNIKIAVNPDSPKSALIGAGSYFNLKSVLNK